MLPHARLRRARLIGEGDNGVTFVPGKRSEAMGFSLPHPGRCSGEKTLTIAIFDDSGSVAGLGGNDPVSQRYREAQLALRHLAVACTCGKEFGAVLHFDCPTPQDVPVTRLRGRGLRRLVRGLAEPIGAFGTSDLAPALTAAEAMAEEFDGGQVQLVVFSDFLLTDRQPDAVLSELAEFPGAVHAVVLTANPPLVLTSDPGVTVTNVGGSSEAGEVARALLASLTEHRVGVATG
ncbi:hypothetical protein H0264_35620 [Nocardia huaxiensis]|uniref:VWFA domain-containing protein n=1 Tax=Nocardia huaxiensis TaxID=2755382 RepID=A0A7D6VE78_9NOCA|nr:hypothetical protein [Nocardia huaxiensis]QLY30395.1 hypothetical protein H0264_35620 [Nocardia huaxiensis]